MVELVPPARIHIYDYRLYEQLVNVYALPERPAEYFEESTINHSYEYFNFGKLYKNLCMFQPSHQVRLLFEENRSQLLQYRHAAVRTIHPGPA